jgi:plastocyanin
MRKTFLVVAVPLAAGVLIAGCGSSSKKSTTTTATPAPAPTNTAAAAGGAAAGGSSSLKLAADPSGALKFDKTKLNAKAGTVTVTMTNPSSLTHGIAVEGNGVDKDGAKVGQGGTSTVTVKLKPGKYTFYCPVDSHRQAGMQGTLTVA